MTGRTPDISKFLHFSFYEPTFPSGPNGEQGWWVGIARLTMILTKHDKVIYRSAIWSALDPAKQNQHLSPLGGEIEISPNYLGDKIFIR